MKQRFHISFQPFKLPRLKFFRLQMHRSCCVSRSEGNNRETLVSKTLNGKQLLWSLSCFWSFRSEVVLRFFCLKWHLWESRSDFGNNLHIPAQPSTSRKGNKNWEITWGVLLRKVFFWAEASLPPGVSFFGSGPLKMIFFCSWIFVESTQNGCFQYSNDPPWSTFLVVNQFEE